MEFEILIESGEDGFHVVSVPDLPGCHTQGRTREEAIENAKEAIALYVETLRQEGREIPRPQRERVAISI